MLFLHHIFKYHLDHHFRRLEFLHHFLYFFFSKINFVFSSFKQGPPQSGGHQFKFNLSEHLDRIKEEFSFLQQQYNQ